MTKTNFHYILFNKPYGILCQFSTAERRKTLADFGRFPKDVYPVGRLDADSEGLVLLTNDGVLKHRLLEPIFKHTRTYLVQVERVPTQEIIKNLQSGIFLDDQKTLPAEVQLLKEEPGLPPRPVPIRMRKNIPTAWLQMILYEGRNRQIRRMTAKVGHPTLRLVRVGIGPLTIKNLNPGEHRWLLMGEILLLRQAVKNRDVQRSKNFRSIPLRNLVM